MKLTNKTPPNLIGISGKIGSGKTTFSMYLQKELSDQSSASGDRAFTIKSFAENVRRTVEILTGIPINKMRTPEDKNVFIPEFDKTVGEMFQVVATKIREVHPDSWVNSLFSTYNSQSMWIIDDVRFPNEADRIKQLGGILIRLEGDPGGVRKNSKRDLNHVSETALDDYKGFDLIVNSDEFSVQDIFEIFIISFL